MKKTTILIFSLLTAFIAAIAFFIGYEYRDSKEEDSSDDKTSQSSSDISSFEECEDAGYPIMESYPRQCRTPEGDTFVEQIDDTGLANPASVYCEEHDGTLDIRDEEDGQVGYCVFENGSECEEWSYFRGTCEPTEEVAESTVTIYFFDQDLFNTPPYDKFLVPATRTTTRSDVATFAVEEIIKGPNNVEQSTGMDPTFGEMKSAWFISESTCSGKDFGISIADGIATVQFCRATMLAGDMSGMIIIKQISDTLKQFDTITRVNVLNSDGHCFDDMAGLDLCLQ